MIQISSIMIAIEQYRAAIGCFHPKCFFNHKNIGNVNELLKLIVISLINLDSRKRRYMIWFIGEFF